MLHGSRAPSFDWQSTLHVSPACREALSDTLSSALCLPLSLSALSAPSVLAAARSLATVAGSHRVLVAPRRRHRERATAGTNKSIGRIGTAGTNKSVREGENCWDGEKSRLADHSRRTPVSSKLECGGSEPRPGCKNNRCGKRAWRPWRPCASPAGNQTAWGEEVRPKRSLWHHDLNFRTRLNAAMARAPESSIQ